MASYAALYTTNSEHDGGERSLSQDHLARRRNNRKQTGTAGNASWASSVINLLNTIVGAGVLAMPHAMSNMGILLGTIVILFAGATAGFGLYLQTRCARYLDRGASSFFALSQITYPNAAVVFDAAIAVKCFGVGVSYLIIIGDLMPGVVRGFRSPDSLIGTAEFLLDRQFWITAFMCVHLVCVPKSTSCRQCDGTAMGQIADQMQVDCNSTIVSTEAGQLEIHLAHCAIRNCVLGRSGCLSLCVRGHNSQQR